MFEFQNTQLQLISLESMKLNILKFCYFIVFMVLLGCGGDKGNDKSTESQMKTEKDSNENMVGTTKTILCFGDSITAGYGLDDSSDAYPAILQQKIDSLNLNYTVINSGLSGETSSGGRSRIDWVLRQNVDIFLLELGANDGLRGIPLTETRSNLQSIIETVKEKYSDAEIILAGMELPPNMGQDYTSEFKFVFADLAIENDVTFIPFILNEVGGIKELNQQDGIHPTIEGHKIVAKTVWEKLRPMLN